MVQLANRSTQPPIKGQQPIAAKECKHGDKMSALPHRR